MKTDKLQMSSDRMENALQWDQTVYPLSSWSFLGWIWVVDAVEKAVF